MSADTTKAKATGATGTTATTKEEKASTINNLWDKEILAKDNKDMSKEKDTTTKEKEKEKDTTTTNKEETEQKESVQQGQVGVIAPTATLTPQGPLAVQ